MFKAFFSSSNKLTTLPELGKLLLLLLIPNVLMFLVAQYYSMARPLINVDYVISLMILMLPHYGLRILGRILLFVAVIIDFLMLVMQVFPFLDMGAFVYLMPFIVEAPTQYVLIILICLSYALVIVWGMGKLTLYRYLPKAQLLILAFIVLLSYPLADWKYHQHGLYSGLLARSNHFVLRSQTELFWDLQTGHFVQALSTMPNLLDYPSNKQRASPNFLQPYSNKILFIIAESWGAYRQPEVGNQIIQAILKEKDKIELLGSGHLDILNSNTIAAEMRELCNKRITGGYAFRKLGDEQFADCLPNILRKQGYHTTSLLGMSGQLFDNYYWYSKAGFQHSLFLENFPKSMKRCQVFHAFCDTEIPSRIAQIFASEHKQFVYWLTVSAHAPFHGNDVVDDKRFDCVKAGMLFDGDICRNAKLNAQLFDSVATLIHQESMKGVEVMIVGDHMPPFFMGEDTRPHIRYDEVGYLHFKIK